MIKISDFARLGDVSVRMLRHYDRIGLLTPAQVDPWSGHRSYAADQLERLNRIVALKALGFTLDEVRRLLDDGLSVEELRGMLRLRESEILAEHAAAQQRLADVAARLRLIERQESPMSLNYVRKPLPAIRLAATRAVVGPDQSAGEVVEPAFERAADAVVALGGSLAVPIAAYDESPAGLTIAAGYEFAGSVSATGDADLEIVTLPAVAEAVCVVHTGPMSGCPGTWQQLMAWIDDQGLTPAGPCREHYLRAEGEDQSDWVVELQQPLA